MAYENFLSRPTQTATVENDEMEPTCQVILAGYGRFGQIIGRLLSAQGYHLTILDHSPGQVELVRGFGNKVYYGDASRRDRGSGRRGRRRRLVRAAVGERGERACSERETGEPERLRCHVPSGSTPRACLPEVELDPGTGHSAISPAPA